VKFDPLILLLVPVFVLSVVVHECAHGLAALACGDTTARDAGRLTLNPLRHVDLVGSILLPAILVLAHAPFVFGWAKPVPVNRALLRDPVNDGVKVALAGPASNLLLALAFAALARLAPQDGFFAPLQLMGIAGVFLNCALALFNLLPIPPLDGSWVLFRFLPMKHIIAISQFRLLGLAALALLMSSHAVSNLLFIRPLRALASAYFALFGIAGMETGL
jgi:Zn-dependent protease